MEPLSRELPSTRCDNPATNQLDATCTRIKSLCVVNGRVQVDTKHNKGTGRIFVKLWCRGIQDVEKDKKPYVDLNNLKAGEDGAVPSWDIAAEKLSSRSRASMRVALRRLRRHGWWPLLKARELGPRRQLDQNQAWTPSRR